MSTPKNKRKFGWMKRLVNGGKEGDLNRTDNTSTSTKESAPTTPTSAAPPGTTQPPMTFDTSPQEDLPQVNTPTQPIHSQSSQQTETQAIHETQSATNLAHNQDYDNSYGTAYNADNSTMNSGSGSENDSVYSQPPNNNAADFYGQMYDAHNSSQLYPSRMDNSSTEGIKSVRDNHSMRSGSVLTDLAHQPAGSTIGSPRSIAKSVGWHSVGSRSPKSIKSTDSLKSGIVGNSWRRRDYYKFLTDEDDDAASITGDNVEAGPSSSNHVRIENDRIDRIDSRGTGTHPHSPLAQSHSSSSLMFDAPSSPLTREHTPSLTTAPHHHSNLADTMVTADGQEQSGVSPAALHGLGVSMEGLSVNEDSSSRNTRRNDSISESSVTEGAEQDCPSTAGTSVRGIRNGSHHSIDANDNSNGTSSHYINGSSHGNGSYSNNTNPNAAARSTSYSSSLSTSGFASPSIMSQNSDGASTSYTVPSGMHHVQLQPQQHQGQHHGPQNLHVNTVPNLDNASIITLASSSKRRRRRSVDTMASTRGIAPASLYVNRSVESLPMDTDTETNHSVER
ncbi:hypothetical protein CJU90_2513 [Yarrowia sp. C11]|nr:hypothetical protein CJU90_2513 [Yarrowia sp. C11]